MTKPLQTPMLLSSCIFKIKTNSFSFAVEIFTCNQNIIFNCYIKFTTEKYMLQYTLTVKYKIRR